MSKQYKFELHAHTAESSRCGRIPAAELVKTYSKLGFDGIVITDHLHESAISWFECDDDWDTITDRFLAGYKAAKKVGDEIGLTVILGAEIRFKRTNNCDYLLYGIDEIFLRSNPYLHMLTPHEFYEKFGQDILIIQAHPFRGSNETVFKECIHGIEVQNTCIRQENRNEKASEFHKANPALYTVCGSDTHHEGDEGLAYMLFNSLPQNGHELMEAIISQKEDVNYEAI